MDGDGAPPAAASQQVVCLSEELARKAEDTARQQEEISQLLAQVVELQQKCRTVSISPCSVMGGTGGTAHSPLPIDSPLAALQYGTEVEELQQHLAAAKEVQQQLRTEVSGGGRGEEGMAAGPHWGCCAQSSNIPPPPTSTHTHTAAGPAGQIRGVRWDAAGGPGGGEEPSQPQSAQQHRQPLRRGQQPSAPGGCGGARWGVGGRSSPVLTLHPCPAGFVGC